MLKLVAALVLVASSSPLAHATPHDRDTAVMVEPIYLIIPMLDLTIEQKVAPHVSLAGTVGYGKLLFGQATIWELGLAANVYRKRTTKGLHVGAEIRYLGSAFSTYLTQHTMTSSSSDRLVGAYLGWKWVAHYGLTAEVQFGVGRMDSDANAPDPVHGLFPIGNLTAGWSI